MGNESSGGALPQQQQQQEKGFLLAAMEGGTKPQRSATKEHPDSQPGSQWLHTSSKDTLKDIFHTGPRTAGSVPAVAAGATSADAMQDRTATGAPHQQQRNSPHQGHHWGKRPRGWQHHAPPPGEHSAQRNQI